MPVTDVKPYVVFLAWLKADAGIVTQVGTRVYEGGIPPDVARGLQPTKYINFAVVGGERHRRIWHYNVQFELECVGPTTTDAWDVYMAVRKGHRTQNKMVTVVGGQSYMFLLMETSPAMDDVDAVSEWPSVKSLWRMTHWEQTA
jgi:hypothetical protein